MTIMKDFPAHEPTVLFACVHNAGRSQMAAGFLRALGGDVVVYSGGSEPADRVNPAAVEAMAEVDIDISREQPQRWDEAIVEAVDVVVTMGCGDECPVYPGTRYLDWELDDPAGKPLEAVRMIRDAIRDKVAWLMHDIGIDEVVSTEEGTSD